MSPETGGPAGGRRVWRDVVIATLLGAVVAGVFLYYRSAGREEPMEANDFNFQQVKLPPAGAAPPAALPAAESPRGTPMPWGVMPGPAKGEAARPKRGGDLASARRRVKELAQGQESRVNALARRYTRRHAVVRDYGRDWMSHPDLKKLNMDYLRDRDAVKFAFGAASSANFAALVQKYAGKPEMHSFLIELVGSIPGEFMAALSDYLHKDRQAQALAQRFAGTAGLPPEAVASLGLEAPRSGKNMAATRSGRRR